VLASAGNAHLPLQLLLVTTLIAGAMAIYGLLLALLGVVSWIDAINALRQTEA